MAHTETHKKHYWLPHDQAFNGSLKDTDVLESMLCMRYEPR